MVIRCKTKLPTLANIKGNAVHTTDKDNEQDKYHFTSQLTDPKLRAHIIVKEEWSEHTFDKVDWTAFETA
jgi:hypothetical protein